MSVNREFTADRTGRQEGTIRQDQPADKATSPGELSRRARQSGQSHLGASRVKAWKGHRCCRDRTHIHQSRGAAGTSLGIQELQFRADNSYASQTPLSTRVLRRQTNIATMLHWGAQKQDGPPGGGPSAKAKCAESGKKLRQQCQHLIYKRQSIRSAHAGDVIPSRSGRQRRVSAKRQHIPPG
jgi:hypothetical protein